MNRRVVGGQAWRLKPIGPAGGKSAGVLPDPARQRSVEGIAHPGGAIIPVIVVMVVPVLRALIPFEEGLKLTPRLWWDFELLHPHRPIDPAIRFHVGLSREP